MEKWGLLNDALDPLGSGRRCADDMESLTTTEKRTCSTKAS